MKSRSDSEVKKFAKSRIASIDVCEIGRKKHHVSALFEIDVTTCREKLKKYKKEKGKISFNAWLIKIISNVVSGHNSVAAFLNGKQKTIIFNDINVSFLIEKDFDGEKFPLPVLIEKANTLDIETITNLLNNSKQEKNTKNQVILNKRITQTEKIYYYLPGFFRRAIWKYLLKHPSLVFSKMGNVAITSLGMYGKINGWFIPISVHPICFGIGSIIKKPVVLNEKIEIREIMHMTVLFDHDVIDGANMARFIKTLVKNIEDGALL